MSITAFALAALLSACGGDLEIKGLPTATATALRTPATPVATATARPATPTSPVATATHTATRVLSATPTRTVEPTTPPANTSKATRAATTAPTATLTVVPTASRTSTVAASATPSITTTPTRVPPTATGTNTATVTATNTATGTAVPSATASATQAPTGTATLTGPTPIPTATFSATATLTPGAETPTPSPTATSNPCNANGLLESIETCETCAADCGVQPCAAVTPLRSFRIDLVPPPFQIPSSVTVQIGYRSNLISLPGSGSAPAARVRSRPTGATVTPNDLDYALRVVASRAGGLPEGRLFIVDFDSCSGAAVPTTADLACTVTGCSSSSGPIAGCTCRVLTP